MTAPAPAASAPPPSLPLSRPAACVLLAVAAALPCVLALDAPFFQMDDFGMLHRHPLVKGERPLWTAFTQPYFDHYAPFHDLLAWTQWQVFGDRALGYRLVGWGLHAGAALACWRMLTLLTRAEGLALGITLLWAAHPAHSESAVWIAEQKTVWFGFFGFCALAVWMDTSRTRAVRTWGTAALMATGALGKVHGMVVGPLVLAHEAILGAHRQTIVAQASSLHPMSRLEACTTNGSWPRRLAACVPCLVLAAAFSVAALACQTQLKDAVRWTFADTILSVPGSLWIYLQVALLPWTVSFFHDLPRVSGILDPGFWLPLTGLAGAAALGWLLAAREDRRLYLFALLAWVLAIGPMLNVAPWTYPAYDRFEYLGLPFLYLALVLAVRGLLARLGHASPSWLVPGLWAAALVCMGIFGLQHGGLYRSEADVMADAAHKNPGNAYGHAALANALVPAWLAASATPGREAEAAELAARIGAETARAAECWNFREFYNNPMHLLLTAGEIQMRSGHPEEAEAFLERAVSEPKWEVHRRLRESALKNLIQIAFDRAARRLADARAAPDTPPGPAVASRLALEDLARARRWGDLGERGLLLEGRAHVLAFGAARDGGDMMDAAKSALAAHAALEKIVPASPYYAEARELLVRLPP